MFVFLTQLDPCGCQQKRKIEQWYQQQLLNLQSLEEKPNFVNQISVWWESLSEAQKSALYTYDRVNKKTDRQLEKHFLLPQSLQPEIINEDKKLFQLMRAIYDHRQNSHLKVQILTLCFILIMAIAFICLRFSYQPIENLIRAEKKKVFILIIFLGSVILFRFVLFREHIGFPLKENHIFSLFNSRNVENILIVVLSLILSLLFELLLISCLIYLSLWHNFFQWCLTFYVIFREIYFLLSALSPFLLYVYTEKILIRKFHQLPSEEMATSLWPSKQQAQASDTLATTNLWCVSLAIFLIWQFSIIFIPTVRFNDKRYNEMTLVFSCIFYLIYYKVHSYVDMKQIWLA